METVQVRPARQPLSALSRLTAASLLGAAGIFAALHVFIFKGAGPPLFIPAIVLLLGVGAVASGRRWAPLVGVGLLGLLLVGLIAPTAAILAQEMTTPGMPTGPLLFLLLPTMLVGVVAGLAATVQNYRHAPGERHAPRWLTPALCIMAGLALGAAGLHIVAAAPQSAGVSAETLATLPALSTRNFIFEPGEIRVKAGELVALRLANADPEAHSFDVDELDLHVLMPPGQDAVALFRPTGPGTYTFYCAPHYNKATGAGMRGTLVVE